MSAFCFLFYRNICSYNSLQGDVADSYASVKKLIGSTDFRNHISKEACMEKMKDIDKQVDSRKDDLMKTDCTIVVAGNFRFTTLQFYKLIIL